MECRGCFAGEVMYLYRLLRAKVQNRDTSAFRSEREDKSDSQKLITLDCVTGGGTLLR